MKVDAKKPPASMVQKSPVAQKRSGSLTGRLATMSFAEGQAALRPSDHFPEASASVGAVQMLAPPKVSNIVSPAMVGEAEASLEMSEMDDSDLLDAVNDKLGVVSDFLKLQVEVADASGGLVEAEYGIRQLSKHLDVLAKAGALREMYRALGRWSAVEAAWEEHQRKPSQASARRVGREAGDMIGQFAKGISKFLPPGLSDIVGMLEGLGPWLEKAAGDIVAHAARADEAACAGTPGDPTFCN